ncbi:uncharacterized protein ARMOST_22518 [Armillaria ostoyae]|uniref:CCHC-type domain-containing protein n=1 Tax=Armillaria ostoyae TaxID=47428 RepID=A0A284SD48_ARMOS|nr:uncharacterized protein ARMOST_22518 [Armillaria ostoyae]
MAQSMPGPNEKSAPRFEKSTDPKELERFFARLEELFDKCAVAPDVDKKKYAVVYIDIKTEKQWKVLEHFVKGTYEEFKKDVLSSYDGALAGDRDVMQELKQLIRRYRLSPIQEKSEYMSFKREFQVLAVVLKKEDLRMEQLNPPAGKTSRDPANPYTLEEVMASGLDILQGVFSSMDRKRDEACGLDTTASSTRELHGTQSGTRNNPSTGESAVKQEDVGGILASMKDIFEQQVQQAQQERQRIAALEKAFIKQQKTITNFLQQQQQQMQAQQYNQYNARPAPSGFGSAPRQMNSGASSLNRFDCWFCGESGHLNAECLTRMDYLNTGKIVMVKGRARLPDGGEFPADIRDPLPKNRIDEYYARQEKNMSQNVLITGLLTPGLLNVMGSLAVLLQEKQDLEHELYELRAQNVNAAPGPRTRSRGYDTDETGRELPTEEERKQGFSKYSMKVGGNQNKTSRVERSGLPSPPEDVNKNQKKTGGAVKEKQRVMIEDAEDSEDDEPALKSKQVRMDPAPKVTPTPQVVVPHVPKDFFSPWDNTKVEGEGGPEKKKDFKRGYTPYPLDPREPAYKIRAPIQERGDRAEVMERVMNTEVPITVGELLSLSKLRDDVKSELTLKWIAFGKKGKSGKQQFGYFIEEEPEEDEEEKEGEETEQVFPFGGVEVEDVEGLPGGAIHISKLPFVGSFMDPILQYVNEAAERGEEPKAVTIFPFSLSYLDLIASYHEHQRINRPDRSGIHAYIERLQPRDERPMTPDLTQKELVGIVTTIVGLCLTSLFTALIVLTWREAILRYLYRHGLLVRPRRRESPRPFPLHYVLPYANSNATMDRPILEEQRLQTRAPHTSNNSDELPPPPPQRNATPGPSNTRHTPSPPPSPASEEIDIGDLRARYENFPPPEYDPNDLPPPERSLLPIRPRPLMEEPRAPAQRIFIRPPTDPWPADESSDEDGGFFGAVARRRDAERVITITTDDENDLDALELPLPDDDGDDSILHLPPPRRPDDPLNADGLDYEWPSLEDVDRDILGPERSLTWDIRRDDVEVRYNLAAHNRVSMDVYLAATYGDELPRLGREAVLAARIFENRDRSRHGPVAGHRLQGPHRGRTHEEQIAIEDALETLARQLGDRPDLEGGGSE